jgi:hypothetical protein
MGLRFPANTIFAYLRKDDVPVCCTRQEAYEWLHGEGGIHRVCIKDTEIDGWTIYTTFRHFSSDPTCQCSGK